MEYRLEKRSETKHVELDFGEVEVGVTKIMSIKVVNQSNKNQSYVVQRDPRSNPLDCVFQTVEHTWSLLPCESYVCDISYKPILPDRKYTDYFFVTDTFECCYKIVVQGFSLGPKVTSSATRLIMTCESQHYRTSKCIKLMNEANVPAKFMFDIDIVQCPFKINEISGFIRSSSSKCLTISFEPTDTGIYKYYIPCLILNQDPIILELYGFCGCKSDKKSIQAFNAKIEDIKTLDIANSFSDYMSDVTTAVKSDPPSISSSSRFIDFGCAEIGLENFGKRTPQTVCLTNHSVFNLYVLWEKDVCNVFSIRPREAKIRGNQSIIFEVRFDPSVERAFYSRELTARICRLSCCPTDDQICSKLLMDTVPEFVSIRLIGHTYGHGSNDCTPQYKIPETVTMPACIPASPVYTTLILRNFGQHPLMFCFVPPATSHYSVKPLMGVICPQQDHQLVAVQLFPGVKCDEAYVERWAVRLNGDVRNEIYVDLQGFAEQASLCFGDENSVTFDPVHVDCEQTQEVAVRNTTRHCVRFEYLSCDFPKELRIEQMNGVIHPNETVHHDWIFAPDQLRNYEFDISCRLNAEIGGRTSVTRIEVSAKSTEGSLITIPEELSFGERAYNEPFETEFKAFNFTPVPIHFLMICRPAKCLEIMTHPENDVKITPKCGTINPGKGEKIQITATPRQPGFYELTVEYFIRSSSSADSSIPLSKPKHLCVLNGMCYLPTVQIQDLLYKSETNQGVSKILLWKYLAIDDFNSALKKILPRQEILIEMIVPLIALKENENFLIKLLVANSNPITASWLLKKRKTCLCDNETIENNVVLKRNSKNGCSYCVYDEAVNIHPKTIILMTNETDNLTIEIQNDTLHANGIFWDLDIGEDRHIVLNVRLERPLILSGPYLKFENVVIGDRTDMRYQAIWLYNNTKCERKYTIEMKNLTLLNKKNYGIIFTCLNPEGIISKFDCKPILFGFCPNKLGKFQTRVNIKVGDNEATLDLEGEPTCASTKTAAGQGTCPFSDTFATPENTVYFSSDCIIVPPLLTHGKATKMIMMHNRHQQDVLSYEWNNYEIFGVVKINIEPSRGLIQPQTLLTFLIEIYVGSYECLLDIDIYCDFVNVSERRLAEKKKIEQENILKQLEGQFTITEKGLTLPRKPVFEEIKKPSTFCKTLTLKIQAYDSRYADEKVDLQRQLKNIPTGEIKNKAALQKNNISPEIISMLSQILECLIWEILNSKFFEYALKNNLTTVHNLKYSQFPKNIVERKYHTERINWKLPKRHVEKILHTMLCMIVHEEFNFDTTHFSHPPDARQISYQKTYLEAYSKQIVNENIF